MESGRPVVLGRVVGAHGIRGRVRVVCLGDGPDNLLHASEVWLGRDLEEKPLRRYAVKAAGTARAGEVRLALEGVADRDAAQELRGQLVLGPAESLQELPEGEYYWHQLIGCEVFGTDGQTVGTVKQMIETGAHDVFVVESAEGRQHLIPSAGDLVREIDIEARRIVVELLPGLIEG